MSRIIELPCDIGDNIYEIIIDIRGKEIYFDRYIVQDVSIKSIKYCDEWKDRNEIGKRIFLDKEMARKAYNALKASDEFQDYKFFEEC